MLVLWLVLNLETDTEIYLIGYRLYLFHIFSLMNTGVMNEEYFFKKFSYTQCQHKE
jgi:hypothetical protein